MRKSWTYLTIVLIFSTGTVYCQGTNANGDSKKFLDLFPTVSSDNLHVYSPGHRTDGEKFEGRAIEKQFNEFFSFDWILKSNLDHGASIFACYKFKYSDSMTGLIVRTRSQYSETSVDLCLWDNQKNKIIKRTELADAFGDGLWHFVKDGWLVDINKDGLLDIVNRKKDWWTDTNDKEHASDSLKVFLGTGQGFKKANTTLDKKQFELHKGTE